MSDVSPLPQAQEPTAAWLAARSALESASGVFFGFDSPMGRAVNAWVIASARVVTQRDDLQARLTALAAEQERTKAQLTEAGAVCMCGCPIGEHENYGDEGECCTHDDHACFRVSPAAYAEVMTLRAEQERLTQENRELQRVHAVAILTLSTVGGGIETLRTEKEAAAADVTRLQAQLEALKQAATAVCEQASVNLEAMRHTGEIRKLRQVLYALKAQVKPQR